VKTLTLLGTTLGFAFAAGLNLYATILVIGVALRLGWVVLPPGLESLSILSHPLVLGTAAILYAVEFLADKIPAVDHAWDAIHTVVRPAGAVWIAWRTIGGSGLSEPAEVALLLAAGGVALTTHAGKAGTRVAAASVGGHAFGLGIALSLLEDVAAFLVAALSLVVPLLVLAVVCVSLVALVVVVRRFRRKRHAAALPGGEPPTGTGGAGGILRP
jgi:hypothetical protein